MVKTSLVENDIEEARTLVNALNRVDSHFLVQSAFWLYQPDSMEWRLVLATPLVDQRGPLSTYRDVQRVLHNLAKPVSLSLQDISVVSPNDKLVKVIKKAIRVPRGSLGVRFGRTRVDDTYIEDVYVYPVVNRAA
jgi:hypothetical protein